MRSLLGKVVWRDTAMTNTAAPIDALTAEVRSRSVGREGRMAMERFTQAGIDTGGAGSPIELASLCHRAGARCFAEPVIAGLAALSGGDEMAALTALVALRPALIGIVQRLVRLGTPTGEAQADVLGAAWEALRSPGSQSARSRAGTVVANTWNACRADSRRAFQHRWVEEAPASVSTAAEPESDPADRVSTLLFDAHRQGVLTRAQAILVHETRVLGRPVAEVAASFGRSPCAVRKQRERIEAGLRAFVADSEDEVA